MAGTGPLAQTHLPPFQEGQLDVYPAFPPLTNVYRFPYVLFLKGYMPGVGVFRARRFRGLVSISFFGVMDVSFL